VIALPSYRPSVTVWLAMVCGMLAAVALVELVQSDSRPVSRLSATNGSSSASAATPGFALPPLAALADVVARPLFLPTRRPVPVLAAAASVPIAHFSLAGIVMTQDRRVAFIQSGSAPPPAMVTVGQAIDGWMVTAIEFDHVVLRNADTTAELSLRDNAPPYRTPMPLQSRPTSH
jgi:hypothetical protein